MLKSALLILFLASTAQSYNVGGGIGGGRPKPHLETIFQWKLLEFEFPSRAQRQQAVANGDYVQDNVIPIDVQPHYGPNGVNRMFVTMPRFETGVPFTLATVSAHAGDKGPILKAYPSIEWHTAGGTKCDGMISVFRLAINECNQMWVVDSGMIGSTQRCPPQLLLFDLNTDQLVQRFRFNTTLYTSGVSLFVTPIITTLDPWPRGRCQNTMVYLADVTGFGLIVYDQQSRAAWRVEHQSMFPDPDYGTHTIAGESFMLMDGILGMSTDYRYLYFHPMASVTEYAIPLSVLNNRLNWANGPKAQANEFLVLGQRDSECAAEAIDSRGNQYCVTFNPIKLISWNVNTPYGGKNLREIPADPKLLEFVGGMKVVRNIHGKEELWMLSSRFQKISAGTQNPNEINFRILKLGLEDVQNGIDYGTRGNFDLHNGLIFN